jgi:hypothetical protein
MASATGIRDSLPETEIRRTTAGMPSTITDNPQIPRVVRQSQKRGCSVRRENPESPGEIGQIADRSVLQML